MHANRHRIACVVGLIALGLFPMMNSGCQTTRVAPFAGKYRAALAADDVVLAMRQADFSDDDILKYGTDVRNALATHGAARVEMSDLVRAIFVAQNDAIYVTTSTGKNFIYHIRSRPNSDS